MIKQVYTIFIFWLVIITFILLQTGCDNTSKKKINSIDYIANMAKVWGFLKYYHPQVAEGEINWDNTLLEILPKITCCKSSLSYNKIIDSLIQSLTPIPICNECKNSFPDSLLINYEFEWLYKSQILEDSIIKKLVFIKENKTPFKNHYVEAVPNVGNTTFKNEIKYEDNYLPSQNIRLLGLIRYWNVIHYFYPYKYLIPYDWNDVLKQFIPKVQLVEDTLQYHLIFRELSKTLFDSHAWTYSRSINDYLGYFNAPVHLKQINGDFIISGTWSDSLARINNLKLGDIILEVDNRSIRDIIEERERFYGASNETSLMRDILSDILCSKDNNKVPITLSRNDSILNISVVRYSYNFLYGLYNKYIKEKGSWNIIDKNIGYVYMKSLINEEVDEMMNNLKNTKAIIFDVRNGARGTLYSISDHLNPVKKRFVNWYIPNLDYPGVIIYDSNYFAGPDSLNKDHYKGLVVILVNNHTQSHGEFTVMGLQTAPNVITIGNRTAGTDGNISTISIPGGITSIFTGAGVCYPDKTESQQKGVKVDIVVDQTIESLRAGEDNILICAMKYIDSYTENSVH
jgi:C-terminal processing protease CtpA/Prc